MKNLIILLVFILLITTNLFAKTLEQKKDELTKIYEAGGISKTEYKKAIEFLEKPEKKEKNQKKKSFSLKNKNKKKDLLKVLGVKKDKDLEEITLEKIAKLGKPVKFDDTYYTENIKKIFLGCNNSFKCRGSKAGQKLFKSFNKSKQYQQKYPGELIKAMAMYEVFYASQLWYARKNIERFKKDKYNTGNPLYRKKEDEKKIRSLFSMQEGQKSMREALGMNLETSSQVAIKKFWLLGEFLDLGTAVKNDKLSTDLKKRQNLIQEYKMQIVNLKKKLKKDQEKDDEKSIE